jgi:hypothetical protein
MDGGRARDRRADLLPDPSGDGVDGFTARDIDHRSIGHGYVSAEAAMQAWADPPDEPRSTDAVFAGE